MRRRHWSAVPAVRHRRTIRPLGRVSLSAVGRRWPEISAKWFVEEGVLAQDRLVLTVNKWHNCCRCKTRIKFKGYL